jgi:hypothetical protein
MCRAFLFSRQRLCGLPEGEAVSKDWEEQIKEAS